jgi:hypothetical protein
MYLVINKCVTAVKVSNFSGPYLRNRSTLDIGVLGYIGIFQHKEHSPEVVTLTRGTPCIKSHMKYKTCNMKSRSRASQSFKQECRILLVSDCFFIILASNTLGPFLPAKPIRISKIKCDYCHTKNHTVVI